MNEDNSIQPQEDKLISQAKKRLLGASIILFILLISAPFVLKNPKINKEKSIINIRNNFEKFNNITYLFNIGQYKVFHLMTQSDYLIFSESRFPFTASLYCSGQIYICKKLFV